MTLPNKYPASEGDTFWQFENDKCVAKWRIKKLKKPCMYSGFVVKSNWE